MELKIKTTVKYHYIAIKMPKPQMLMTPNAEALEPQELSHSLLVGMQSLWQCGSLLIKLNYTTI
jgi:hypothetical protein